MTPPDPGGGIRARGIRRSFGPVHAVQGVDLIYHIAALYRQGASELTWMTPCAPLANSLKLLLTGSCGSPFVEVIPIFFSARF